MFGNAVILAARSGSPLLAGVASTRGSFRKLSCGRVEPAIVAKLNCSQRAKPLLGYGHLRAPAAPATSLIRSRAACYYLSEVPYTQFFHMPFALHSAYWHDRFGEPKSGGCVNLSPKDAKWLFDWTLPHVPATWHSVRSGDSRGMGTWVRVR